MAAGLGTADGVAAAAADDENRLALRWDGSAAVKFQFGPLGLPCRRFGFWQSGSGDANMHYL